MSPAAEYIFNLSLTMTACYQAPYTKYGPGQFVLTRDEKTRQVLRQLKSEDLQNIRDDLVFISNS